MSQVLEPVESDVESRRLLLRVVQQEGVHFRLVNIHDFNLLSLRFQSSSGILLE